uniref:G8 domain-containing protein n=1 Tax=Magallana gigas TaxID=29159 RepID=A0A8W8N7Q0_MAGGI|nr:cell migration-inducing and hyaluronan-binding protein-like [Crassostrea gigas]
MERTGWILVTSCLVALVSSQGCPDDDLNLKKWSDDATWNGQLPQEGDSLVIQDGDSFLLDTSPPPLDSITIESGGKLVVADGMDIKLSVKYILIRGEMHVGSEDCKFTGKLHITLRGNLGEYKVDGFGEKFIGVASGGVLEIHGEYRLPWTKLASNVKAVDFISNVKNIAINANKQDNAEVKDDDEDDEGSDDVESDDDKSNTADATTDPNVRESIKMEALVIYVFNEQTGVMESAARLVTTGGKPKDFPKKVEEAREVLDSIPAGRIVAIALKRRFRVGKVDTSGLFDMLEQWAYGAVDGSSLKFRDYKFHGAWAMIKKQGDDSSIQELLLNDDGKPLRIAELYHMENGLKFSVRSWVHTVRRNQCYCRGKSSSLSIINLVDDVQTWRKGDQVVLLSTDFDWEQREFGNIIDCPSCTSNQLLLDLEPRFDHFGEIYKNVDMRGEVALTNRTIVIEGEADANGKKMGGHIKFLKGFKTVQVNNVELVRMGQQTSLGNYPLHFHMCGDVDDREKPSLLSGNSIRDSFARCITVHGSHGAQVKNNFCLNTLGHGYFLEDGGEKRTVLDGNLGAGQKRSSLIETDKFPTTFWITNPQTYVRNNVAAGGEGHGFWFVYPNQPWDASKGLGMMELYEAMHTAIFEFDNNVAHSYKKSGLFIDNILKEDGSLGNTNTYEPWNDPKDPDSGAKMVTISRLTAYKNMKQNAWINGGYIKVTQSSFSDSIIGLTFKRSSPQEQLLDHSVFVGDSPNIGSASVVSNSKFKTWGRSVPLEFADQPRQGFVFYHGPVYVSDTWFGDFADTDNYRSGALGFQRDNDGHSSPISAVSGIKFSFSDPLEGNRVFDGNATDTGFTENDGDLIGTFRDTDGTVYKAGAQIVKDILFHSTPNCVQRTNWKMMACEETFGQVRLSWGSWGWKAKNGASDVSIYRDDLPDNPIAADSKQQAPFMALLGGQYSYMARMNGNMPKSVKFTALGFTKAQTARVGLCVPRDATVKVKFLDLSDSSWKKGSEVTSLDELDASTNPTDFFADSEVGVVFFKPMHDREYTSTDLTDCLDSTCPSVTVTVSGGDSTDSDCISRAYPKYQRESSDVSLEPDTTSLPLADLYPPSGWGAGSTRD